MLCFLPPMEKNASVGWVLFLHLADRTLSSALAPEPGFSGV
jgi:hypothetical protein